MCKLGIRTLVILALLLAFALITSARPQPHSGLNQNKGAVEIAADEDIEESCEGKVEEKEKDECLMRRILDAHKDYIYTCGNCPPQRAP